MKKYNSYKDSGVEWIGEIPSHWTKSKLKFVSEIVTGNTPPTKDIDNYEGGEHLWVKPNEIKGLKPTNDTNQKLTEKGKSFSRVLPPFSVLVNGIGRIGEFGHSEKYVSTNQQINSIVYNHKVDKRFGLFHTSMMKEGFLSNSEKVVVPILNKTKQENLEFVLPPLSEQEQIVSFLDTKTSLIDSLIEKTQQKIELLKEKRISLINEVVTKGLNPNVEMKDSGVEWIGEIPSHWELPRLNNLGDFSKGKGITKDKIKESGHKCIRCGEIYTTYELRFNETNSFIDDETSSESVLGFKGVLLFTGDGESLEEIGKCVVYEGEEELYIGGGINVFTPKQEKVIPIYLSYVMSSESVIFQKSRQGKGEIVVHIYSKQLKEIRLGLPPFTEQQQIVEYLDEQTGLIDKTISIEEKRIELLKEYRQSLISEVVTGKQKVV